MNELILTRYIHFIGIIIVFGMVLAELVLIQDKLKRSVIKRIFILDGIYGAFSLIVVGAGLYLWLGIGKPAEFYTANPLMHAKVGLFIIEGILSIWPTVFYFKNRKGEHDQMIAVPAYIKRIIQVELGLLVLIPLLATFMAQGVGL